MKNFLTHALTSSIGLSQLLIAGSPAVELPSSLQTIDQSIEQALNAFQIPGIAVGIIIDGNVVFTKGYGFRDVANKLPVTEQTIFAIGSCTKAFTAFLLGQLVDEGKISWDDCVIQHIPEFRLADFYTTHTITLRDLLAHRSGLARHDFVWFHSEFRRSHIFKILPYLEPACPLREKFCYNNLLYTIAGTIAERVLGDSWESAIAERIFTPLGMKNSYPGAVHHEQLSLGYSKVDGSVKEIPPRLLHAIAPAGAIHSNIQDLSRWVQLQLGSFERDGKAISLIRPSLLQEMHSLQMPMTWGDPETGIDYFGYGLGWMIGLYKGHYLVDHGGGIDGFISQITLLPRKKIGVILLTNSSSDGPFASMSLTRLILDKILGEQEVDHISKQKELQNQIQTCFEDVIKEKSLSTPLHSLEEYAGLYEHPAYGILQVESRQNTLKALYGNIQFSLYHKYHGIFQGKSHEPLFGEKDSFHFAFSPNTSGDISEVRVSFETTTKPIIFQKKVDPTLFSSDYLKQFEGSFGDNPLSYTVFLKGEKLFLSSGPSEHELLPDKGKKFKIKGLPTEYCIEFTPEENGIEELIFTVPSTVPMHFKKKIAS